MKARRRCSHKYNTSDIKEGRLFATVSIKTPASGVRTYAPVLMRAPGLSKNNASVAAVQDQDG